MSWRSQEDDYVREMEADGIWYQSLSWMCPECMVPVWVQQEPPPWTPICKNCGGMFEVDTDTIHDILVRYEY